LSSGKFEDNKLFRSEFYNILRKETKRAQMNYNMLDEEAVLEGVKRSAFINKEFFYSFFD